MTVAESVEVNFVDIPFTPDADQMADDAVDELQSTWQDWEPDDADPEVILIEACAPMAAEAEAMAAQMPAEALRTAGTQLYGIDYDEGSPAQTTVTLTFVDGSGYTVPAGGQINIDGYAFGLINDATIPADPGSGPFVLAGVPVACAVYTQEANGLTGTTVVSLDLPQSVSTITVDSATTDGTDPMDDDEFLLKVVAKLQLRADTLITARDFALEATLVPGIGFAWAVGNNAREVQVTIADPNGLPVPQDVKDALDLIYSDPSVRSVNVNYEILDPTYTEIDVTWSVVATSQQAAIGLEDVIDQRLTTLLSPLTAEKDGTGMIYRNLVLARIGALQGVERVVDVTLATPTAGASVNSNGDVVMVGGAAALPTPGTFTATVTT